MRIPRTRHIGVVIACALAASAACDGSTKTPEVRTCRGATALSVENIVGTSLPDKTLALTFDDGPGVRTAELSTWLASEGVRAAFFVNGKMIASTPGGSDVVAQLARDGHLVANHTQTHRSLTGRMTGAPRLSPAEAVAELAETDALIAPYAGARLLFRAPFGDYDAETAAVLQGSPMAKYVGPIFWDIGDHMGPSQAADWDCWVPGSDHEVLTPQQCGARYAAEIERVGRGIVLLHDPYFPDDDPARGGTVEMVKQLVPALRAKGYTFVRVDEVPAIAELLPPVDAGAPTSVDAGPPSNTSPDATPEAGTPRQERAERGVEDAATPADPCAR